MRLAFVLLLTIVAPAFAQKTDDFFPLAKGMFWIYRGPTSWVQPNPSTQEKEIKTETLTWKMEVVDAASRGNFYGALIKGMPDDLAWYEPAKPRGDYLILRKGGTKYFLLSGNDAKVTFEKLKAKAAPLEQLMEDEEIILDLPLTQDKTFGGDPAYPARRRYCWVVEGANPFDSSKIKGAPSEAKRVISLTHRTNPDHEFIGFVPGLGIVSFEYGHHGTVSETSLELIEFGQQTASRENKH